MFCTMRCIIQIEDLCHVCISGSILHWIRYLIFLSNKKGTQGSVVLFLIYINDEIFTVKLDDSQMMILLYLPIRTHDHLKLQEDLDTLKMMFNMPKCNTHLK